MRHTTIDIPIFFGKLTMILTDDWESAGTLFNLDVSKCHDGAVWQTTTDGLTHFIAGFRGIPSNMIIAHEAVHLVNLLFKDRDINLDLDNDEPQAYVTGWFIQQIEQFIHQPNNMSNKKFNIEDLPWWRPQGKITLPKTSGDTRMFTDEWGGQSISAGTSGIKKPKPKITITGVESFENIIKAFYEELPEETRIALMDIRFEDKDGIHTMINWEYFADLLPWTFVTSEDEEDDGFYTKEILHRLSNMALDSKNSDVVGVIHTCNYTGAIDQLVREVFDGIPLEIKLMLDYVKLYNEHGDNGYSPRYCETNKTKLDFWHSVLPYRFKKCNDEVDFDFLEKVVVKLTTRRAEERIWNAANQKDKETESGEKPVAFPTFHMFPELDKMVQQMAKAEQVHTTTITIEDVQKAELDYVNSQLKKFREEQGEEWNKKSLQSVVASIVQHPGFSEAQRVIKEQEKPSGYHKKPITKGVLGEVSKIREELDELTDAVDQDDKILMAVEAADLFGALESFAETKLGMSIYDIAKFSDKTKAAFKSGRRSAK